MEELKKIAENKLPRHIGLILDGNRRWAIEKGLSANKGHLAGYETLTKMLQRFFEVGIRYLSIYALSLENVKKRTPEELKFIYKLIMKAVERVKVEPIVVEEKIRFNVIGRLSLLPAEVKAKIDELIEFTKGHDKGFVNLCILYDGQAEIVDAVKRIIIAGEKPEDVDEKLIKTYLYTKDFPEVDYIIRTGMSDGARISGFLLWDSSYAEFKFRNDYWPDYDEEMMIEDLNDYVNRNRRKGK